jgi:hypothetical protein
VKKLCCSTFISCVCAVVFVFTAAGTAAAATYSLLSDQLTYVRITTTGSTFSPAVELAEGSQAVVGWYVEEDQSTYEGLSPEMTFNSPDTRHIRMSAAYSDGSDALKDVVTFNIGFNHTEDAGYYNAGSAYDHPVQKVTEVEGVNHMTGLLRFLAATPTLTGEIDFTGMSKLEFIECFGADVSAIDLTGCGSLIRLCMEDNDLSYIDLNPVRNSLYDLRLTGNRSTITIAPLQSPMVHQYHYCAHSQTVINHPTSEQLPAVEELWDWNSGQAGELVIRSSAVRDVRTYENGWTSADLTNQFPSGRRGHFDAHSCRLSSIILEGCSGLTYLDLHDNLFDQDAVDGILAEVASWGTYGGKLNLSENRYPSADGERYLAILEGRDWEVSVSDAPWKNLYRDVSDDAWYYDEVKFVSEHGLMNGTESDVFSPDGTMSRAMFVTVLYRISRESGSYTNTYADVPAGAWYEKAVAWAGERNLAVGVADNRFRPEAAVTREEIAMMLYNLAKYVGLDVSVGEDTNLLSYNDVSDIAEYAIPALQWACGAGIMEGDNLGNLNPRDSATRAEVAVILHRFLVS